MLPCVCQSCEANDNGAVYSVGIKAAAIILMFMMKVMCSFQERNTAGSSVLEPACSALYSRFCLVFKGFSSGERKGKKCPVGAAD